jgi:hypothetical protein
MSSEFEKYITLLEKRLALLRNLAKHFVDCRKDFVSMNIDAMYARIGEMEELCRQIQALTPAIESLWQSCTHKMGTEPRGPAATPEIAEWMDRLRLVMRELGETEAEVGRLNQIHAAYLQRSRKTIHVLMNSLGINALSYAARAEFGAIAGQTSEKG